MKTKDEAKPKRKPRSRSSVSVGPETEITDFHGVERLFGLRRSMAYHICQEAEKQGIQLSISLKNEGEKRGKRLFLVPKIRQFLLSKVETAEVKQAL
jgi:hypothetical protein